MADTKRNRLLVWGGGHNDYYGNELYALDLSAGKMLRLTEPSKPPVACAEAQPDGRPSARHTYANLAYLSDADTLYSFGGSPACENGHGSYATWTLNLATMQWKQMQSSGGTPNGSYAFVAAAYDPVTRKVYVDDTNALWDYDFERNRYAMRNSEAKIAYGMTAAIAPDRRLLLAFGSGMARAVKLGGGFGLQKWDAQVKGCDGLRGAFYPGLAYDSDLRLFVGWAGGESVYLFDPDKKTCTTQTFASGPGAPQEHGTYGRFAFFPALHVFALVNDWKQDAWVLRLAPVSAK